MTVNKMNPKQQTKIWLNTFIVPYAICPFAQKVIESDTLRYRVDETTTVESSLQCLFDECLLLDRDETIETTLIIYPQQFSDFDDFLDYLELAIALLNAQGYEGVYQLADFHPRYCFAETDELDPANYTNRSPFPMLHLLREASIEKALLDFEHPEQIPERNIALTRQLGLVKMQALLAACKPERE